MGRISAIGRISSMGNLIGIGGKLGITKAKAGLGAPTNRISPLSCSPIGRFSGQSFSPYDGLIGSRAVVSANSRTVTACGALSSHASKSIKGGFFFKANSPRSFEQPAKPISNKTETNGDNGNNGGTVTPLICNRRCQTGLKHELCGNAALARVATPNHLSPKL